MHYNEHNYQGWFTNSYKCLWLFNESTWSVNCSVWTMINQRYRCWIWWYLTYWLHIWTLWYVKLWNFLISSVSHKPHRFLQNFPDSVIYDLGVSAQLITIPSFVQFFSWFVFIQTPSVGNSVGSDWTPWWRLFSHSYGCFTPLSFIQISSGLEQVSFSGDGAVGNVVLIWCPNISWLEVMSCCSNNCVMVN